MLPHVPLVVLCWELIAFRGCVCVVIMGRHRRFLFTEWECDCEGPTFHETVSDLSAN